MKTKEFLIEGMSCNHCVKSLEKSFSLSGINEAKVEVGKAIITFDENALDEKNIITIIEDNGFKIKI